MAVELLTKGPSAACVMVARLPEILFIALKRGYRVTEVPVSWAHDERSRISYLRDGLRMLQDIAIVRWNALLGRYNKQVERIHRAGLVK
jgi:hypothetical protein